MSKRDFVRGFSLLPICAFTALSGSRAAKAGSVQIIDNMSEGSPPLRYTTFNHDDLTVHCIVGIPGRAKIENIQITEEDARLI
jgi:hypothetical protein